MPAWGGSWLCCMHLCTTTLFTLSDRSQGAEARVSDWCSRIAASPTDASGDADPGPAATVKSLIESFDTVGQSECWAPQQHTRVHGQPRQQRNRRGQLLPVETSALSLLSRADPTVRTVQLSTPTVVVCIYWNVIYWWKISQKQATS